MTTATEELRVGQLCWIEHKMGFYQGVEDDGRHVVKIEGEDAVIMRKVDYAPIPEFVPPHGPVKHKESGTVGIPVGETAWLRDGKLVPYVRIDIPAQPGKGYDYIRLSELQSEWEPAPDAFLDDEEIARELEAIDDEAYPIIRAIRTLNDRLREVNAKRKPWQDKCAHEWEKDEEEPRGNNMLGTSFQQRCYCTKCGLEKMDYYTKLG